MKPHSGQGWSRTQVQSLVSGSIAGASLMAHILPAGPGPPRARYRQPPRRWRHDLHPTTFFASPASLLRRITPRGPRNDRDPPGDRRRPACGQGRSTTCRCARASPRSTRSRRRCRTGRPGSPAPSPATGSSSRSVRTACWATRTPRPTGPGRRTASPARHRSTSRPTPRGSGLGRSSVRRAAPGLRADGVHVVLAADRAAEPGQPGAAPARAGSRRSACCARSVTSSATGSTPSGGSWRCPRPTRTRPAPEGRSAGGRPRVRAELPRARRTVYRSAGHNRRHELANPWCGERHRGAASRHRVR